MSDLTPVGILLLSMLIFAFLQLVPGVFMLFSHYKFGQMSRNKASDLNTFFILGAETFIVIIFLATFAILNTSPFILEIAESAIFNWISAGVLLALAVLFATIYYRAGATSSELFISRRFAKNITSRAKSSKTRSEAFLLGLSSAIPELIFTFPLYILANLAVLTLASSPIEHSALVILFALVAILPLFIIHFTFATRKTLAPLMKFRFNNRPFFRFIIPFFYFLIAVLIILRILL